MLDEVLRISKSVDDEKVGISFQMPKSLKKEVDVFCSEHDIKLTTFFNSLTQVALDELKGKGDLKLIEARKLAKDRLDVLNSLIDEGAVDIDNAVQIHTERERLIELFGLGEAI